MNTASDSTLTPMLATERRAVGIVALVGMFRMFGLFALLPVLSVYAAGLQGATPVLIGLAVGGYGLTQAAMQIPLGAISDRVGRLPVILAGLLVFAAGSVVAAESSSIYGVVLGRLLQGAGAISSTLTALLADVTRTEVRTRTMAVYGIGVGASILLALIFGPVIAAASGVRGLFVLCAVMAFVAAALMLVVPRTNRSRPVTLRTNLRVAFKPALLKLDLYIFLVHALLTAMFVALPFLLRDDLGLPLARHWQVYVVALLLSVAGTLPLIRADDRKGKQGTIRVALACLLAGLLLLAFASVSVFAVGAALAAFFAGLNFLESALPARLSILADADQRGASLGVFSSAQFLGAFFGGVGGGILLSTDRTQDVFLVAAAVTALWLVFHQFDSQTHNPAKTT